MTLSINRCAYPALRCFALIVLILMSKFDAICLDQCKSPEMVFSLYLFGILETQGTAFLYSFRYTCVVTIPSLFKTIFVSKKSPYLRQSETKVQSTSMSIRNS